MRILLGVLAMVSAACADLPQFHTSFFMDEWRSTNDVVEGWDWSLPPGTKPAEGSALSVASDLVDESFPGRLMRKVNTSWKEIEPVEGEFAIDRIRELVLENSEHGKYALELHVRASVWDMRMFPEEAEYPETWPAHIEETRTAPRWLDKYNIPRVEMKKFGLNKIGTPFQIVNMDVTHPDYHSRYIRMVKKLGESGVLAMPEVSYIFVHYFSGSRGEEGQSSDEPRSRQVYLERLRAWAESAGEHAGKLCAISHKPDDVEAAVELGMGQRNGFVEMYLLHCNNRALGQSMDADGYLVVDEENPIIKENRASGDENEEYALGTHERRFGPVEFWPHRYREAMLRSLQMRRNFLWAENGSILVDPPLLGFTALELGHSVETAPDAWCRLRESYVKKELWTGPPVAVKNFERWLCQRDRKGYETVPVRKMMHGRDFAEYGSLGREYVKGKNFDFSARKGRRIGFEVDDRFLPGGPGPVAVKITYYDEPAAGSLILKCSTGSGVQTRTVDGRGDGELRTATFFVDEAVLDGVFDGFDFAVEGSAGDVTLAFVRVVKLDVK